jgi:hypothetical protein
MKIFIEVDDCHGCIPLRISSTPLKCSLKNSSGSNFSPKNFFFWRGREEHESGIHSKLILIIALFFLFILKLVHRANQAYGGCLLLLLCCMYCVNVITHLPMLHLFISWLV